MENLEKILDSFISFNRECAGSPVIEAFNFPELATALATESGKSQEYVLALIKRMSLKFSSCGGNLGEKSAVLRKYPKSKWGFIINKLADPEEPANE